MNCGANSYTADLVRAMTNYRDMLRAEHNQVGYVAECTKCQWISRVELLIEEVERLPGPNVPEGWQAVPFNPTGKMMIAADGAIRELILRTPPEQRKWKTKKHGFDIPQTEKMLVRWHAMLAAAPRAEEVDLIYGTKRLDATGTPQEDACTTKKE